MRCMRGQRSSLGFFVILFLFVSLALGTASFGGRPFDVRLCRHQSPRSFAHLFQDRSQTVPSYQLPSTAHVLGMRNDNQSTPPAGRQADGQMLSTQYF